jgi:predicted SnoaL-like aldol condensation-catalyzing enzyme
MCLFALPSAVATPPPNPSAPPACSSTADANRTRVLAFYAMALKERRLREAFELYMSEDFVEHKPDVPAGTRAATIDFLEGLMKQVPEGRWEILRSAAQDDLVFIHVSFVPAPGAPAYAIADVFRLSECRIVEHWDVVDEPRPGLPNPNSRF